MPMSMLKLRPGVNVEVTPSQLEAGIAAANLIRHRGGLPEKLGGWDKFYPFAVGGVPRAMHAWQDYNDTQYLGVGSTTVLATISGATLTEVTPQTLTSDFAPNFTTSSSSALVTINDANIANVTTYDAVEFKTPVAVGGIVLSGIYPIDLVLSATQYRIVAAATATASVSNAGAVPVFDTVNGSQVVQVTLEDHGLVVGNTVNFPIPTTGGGVTISGTYAVTALGSTPADEFEISVAELASSTTSFSMNAGDAQILYHIALGPVAAGTGYGIGTYGSGGYGTGAGSSSQSGTPITATDYSLENWGQTFIANPAGRGIYVWTPNTGFQNARLVPTAPIINDGIIVTMPAQILLAWGSTAQQNIGVDQDPLVYRWSDQLDYEFWTPGVANPATGNFSQAGSARIPTGSRIVAGMQASQQTLLWTDLDLWAITYLGLPEQGIVFGQNKIGASCGAIGRKAATQLGGVVYWMGRSNFFRLAGGGVQVMPCTVWDTVFQDINTAHQHKSWAWANTPFNEVWFFWPRASTGATEPDSYVKLNLIDGVWDKTADAFARSCGIDQSLVGMPISATPGGIIYEHEISQDAEGQPINAWIETGWFPLSDGQDMIFMDWLLPDMKWGLSGGSQNATLTITLYAVNYPGDAPVVHGPYTVTQSTQYIAPRLRGRLAKIRVESNDLGSFWRLGGIRNRWAASGRN